MAFTASTIPDIGPGSRTVRFRGRDLQSMESIHSAVATLNLEGIPAVAKYQGGTFVVSAREGRLEISKDFGTDETVFHWSPDPALTLNKTYGYYYNPNDLPF